MLLSAIRTACYGGIAMATAAKFTYEIALPDTHPLQPLLGVARAVAGRRINAAVVEPPPFEDAQAAYDTLHGDLRTRLEAAHLIDLTYGRVESAETATRLIAEDAGQEHTAAWLRLATAWAAAVMGDEQFCIRRAEQVLHDEPAIGIGFVDQRALRVLCLPDISAGRYAEALDRMDAMIGQSRSLDGLLAPEDRGRYLSGPTGADQ